MEIENKITVEDVSFEYAQDLVEGDVVKRSRRRQAVFSDTDSDTSFSVLSRKGKKHPKSSTPISDRVLQIEAREMKEKAKRSKRKLLFGDSDDSEDEVKTPPAKKVITKVDEEREKEEIAMINLLKKKRAVQRMVERGEIDSQEAEEMTRLMMRKSGLNSGASKQAQLANRDAKSVGKMKDREVVELVAEKRNLNARRPVSIQLDAMWRVTNSVINCRKNGESGGEFEVFSIVRGKGDKKPFTFNIPIRNILYIKDALSKIWDSAPNCMAGSSPSLEEMRAMEEDSCINLTKWGKKLTRCVFKVESYKVFVEDVPFNGGKSNSPTTYEAVTFSKSYEGKTDGKSETKTFSMSLPIKNVQKMIRALEYISEL